MEMFNAVRLIRNYSKRRKETKLLVSPFIHIWFHKLFLKRKKNIFQMHHLFLNSSRKTKAKIMYVVICLWVARYVVRKKLYIMTDSSMLGKIPLPRDNFCFDNTLKPIEKSLRSVVWWVGIEESPTQVAIYTWDHTPELFSLRLKWLTMNPFDSRMDETLHNACVWVAVNASRGPLR